VWKRRERDTVYFAGSNDFLSARRRTKQHPKPLGYDEIAELLETCGLIISDETRLHRKVSEIRRFLVKFHPSLEDIIVNTRGIGYGLPLRFRNLPDMVNDNGIRFKNKEIIDNIAVIAELIEDAIHLTAHGKIIRNSQGYVMERNAEILWEKISIFNECEKMILQQIRMHEADFIFLRVQYLLAKLKTYIGLARISAYAISEAQWMDWFKSEIYTLFDDLKKMIKEAEN
jgi:hypothetical protein